MNCQFERSRPLILWVSLDAERSVGRRAGSASRLSRNLSLRPALLGVFHGYGYSMCWAVFFALSSFKSLLTTCKLISIPAAMPAEQIMRPLSTKRWSSRIVVFGAVCAITQSPRDAL